MASEIRVNTINNRSGLGTISITNSGAVFSGVTTFAQIKTTSGEVTVGTGASVFSPATNVLALGTNNTEKVRIDASGRIGFGTNSPQTALHLFGSTPIIRLQDSDSTGTSTLQRIEGTQTGSTQWFVGQNSTSDNELWIQNITNDDIRFGTNNTERLRITNTGNIGIGTDNPQGVLHLLASDAKLIIQDSDSSGNSGTPRIQFQDSTGAPAHGEIGYVGTGDSDLSIINKENANIQFHTNNTEKVRISSSGNVGIGTDNPAIKLTLYGTNQEDLIYISTGNNAGDTFANIRGDNESGIRIRGGGSYDGGVIELGGGLRNTDPGIVKFSTGTGTSPTERLRITSGGFVNIGGNFTQTDYTAQVTRIGGNTDTMQIKGSTQNAFIRFTDNDASSDYTLGADDGPGSDDNNFIVYDRNAVAYRLVLRSDGNFGIGVNNPLAKLHVGGGNIKVDSGYGIDFSAKTPDGSGASIQSELLDDYEEGGWSPSIDGLSNSPSYSNLAGRYTKIGRMVVLKMLIQPSTNPTFTNTSSFFLVSGIPFTSGNNNAAYFVAQGGVRTHSLDFTNSANNASGTTASWLTAGLSNDKVVLMANNNNAAWGEIRNNMFHNKTWILELQMTYFTDQ